MAIASWRHPRIEREMFDDTPGAELLQIIDAAEWNGRKLWQLESASPASMPDTWENRALDLEGLLMSSSMGKEAERLLKHYKLDRLMLRLKEDQPDRVFHRRTKTARHWMIHAPIEG